MVADPEEGASLKSVKTIPSATLNELAGCLNYTGALKSLEEMEEAIQLGANKAMDDCES